MAARKFNEPSTLNHRPSTTSVSTIIIPEDPAAAAIKTATLLPGHSTPSTLNHEPSTILWLSPQQLADIRLQYEIDEMLAGHRPAFPTTHRGSSDK